MCAAQIMGRSCLRWVNMRNTRSEYFTSDIPSITDIARTSANVRVVPQGDVGERSCLLRIRSPIGDPGTYVPVEGTADIERTFSKVAG
jgi:hypothetical protein